MEENKISISKYSQSLWHEIYQRLYGGIVFIDDSCAECLHWEGGLMNLIDAGAIGVKSLSPFECGLPDQKKAIFITKGTESNLDTIRDILSNSKFINCILILTANSDIISSEMNGRTYADIEENVIQWIGKKQCAVEIMFSPLFAVGITNNIFMTPGFGKMFPKFGDHLLSDQPLSVDLHSLLAEEKNSVRRLACCLNNFLEYLNLKDDIYYIGAFSSILSGVLEHLPAASIRRKNASGNISLVLVDRSIDLCSVTSYNSESILDKIICRLPRFPSHNIDVAVDISFLCESDMVSVTDDVHLCPGCISHPASEQSVQLLDHFINKTQPEVMLALYNKLSNLNVASPSRLPPRVTAQNLEKLVQHVKGNLIEKHCELLQQTLAVIQALKSPLVPQHELMMCLEKQVLQNITTSRDSTSVLLQISNIIKNRRQRGLSLENLLSLLVHIYSLTGCDITFSDAQEENLYDSLSIALFEDRNQLSLNINDIDKIQTPEKCSEFARNIIRRLKDVAKARETFQRYKSVIKVTDEISPSEYRGTLQQLVYDMVDIERPEMPDLKCRTEGIKDFIRSGFSMLMSTTKKKPYSAMKHPFDNPSIIIFVIGGMTADECSKMHRAIITSGTDANVIIGSTSIVNPTETMKHALFLA